MNVKTLLCRRQLSRAVTPFVQSPGSCDLLICDIKNDPVVDDRHQKEQALDAETESLLTTDLDDLRKAYCSVKLSSGLRTGMTLELKLDPREDPSLLPTSAAVLDRLPLAMSGSGLMDPLSPEREAGSSSPSGCEVRAASLVDRLWWRSYPERPRVVAASGRQHLSIYTTSVTNYQLSKGSLRGIFLQ